jgi:hypothetical protein
LSSLRSVPTERDPPNGSILRKTPRALVGAEGFYVWFTRLLGLRSLRGRPLPPTVPAGRFATAPETPLVSITADRPVCQSTPLLLQVLANPSSSSGESIANLTRSLCTVVPCARRGVSVRLVARDRADQRHDSQSSIKAGRRSTTFWNFSSISSGSELVNSMPILRLPPPFRPSSKSSAPSSGESCANRTSPRGGAVLLA